jgi:two-component system cell cycle sensor histidine kinase/response regulator CckA
LKSAGFGVLTANHGEQALQFLEQRAGDIDLLLSDVKMPRMSGPELVLRVGQIAPETKCVLMSGYCDSEQHEGFPLIHKPFTSSSLLTKIRELLVGCNGACE